MQEMRFAEHRVEVDGFSVRYLEAGAGLPLVMVHGAGGLIISQAHLLLARRFRVIALECPGFHGGVNDRTKDGREMAATLAAAVEAIGVERYALQGTSMGGVVACWLAVQYPERLTSLILEAPAAFRGAATPAEMTPEQMMAAFHAHPERKQITPPDPEAQARVWPLVERLVGSAHDDALAEALRGLTVPTLVMYGTRDGLFGVAPGRTFKELIAPCTFVKVYDAAHDIAGDRPEAFADLVGEFAERQERFYVPRASTVINR
ncbi:hydrolase [Actinomadura sp. NBRC 104425]|uniref:alpha/beta fold hydrolase n=1 Tax=Actinomadura sp. NBRC 104425 TaxID=3032204 RepID=UPI0024A2874E|nr:alpha/beta hydrolase [Actinomadura sp. NBRC 104425]GLZ11988.1 hydrolase [Actinomadura sp. NBRC 104425]